MEQSLSWKVSRRLARQEIPCPYGSRRFITVWKKQPLVSVLSPKNPTYHLSHFNIILFHLHLKLPGCHVASGLRNLFCSVLCLLHALPSPLLGFITPVTFLVKRTNYRFPHYVVRSGHLRLLLHLYTLHAVAAWINPHCTDVFDRNISIFQCSFQLQE